MDADTGTRLRIVADRLATGSACGYFGRDPDAPCGDCPARGSASCASAAMRDAAGAVRAAMDACKPAGAPGTTPPGTDSGGTRKTRESGTTRPQSGTREGLTGRERAILDAWPRYADGEPVWFGDRAVAGPHAPSAVESVHFEEPHDGPVVCTSDWECNAAVDGPLRRAPQPEGDTWERVEADTLLGVNGYCLERGIPTGPAPEDSLRRAALDIVRRCRELAGASS